MLFDLRGRGRRRSVRVIYMGLALLFGVGFIGFGVGVGAGGGGIFNALSENGGSSGATFAKEIKKYRKLTQEHPNSASAWEQLLKVQLREAGNESYVTRTGQVTSKGKELFHQISQSWSSYLAVAGAKPSAELAQEMITVYGKEGLDEPSAEVQVLQIVVAARPIARYYFELAAYAYLAHNTRVGDLAGAKAVSVAPAADQARIKSELAAIKKHPSGSEESAAATATQGVNLNGSSTTAPTTSQPAGQSPSKK